MDRGTTKEDWTQQETGEEADTRGTTGSCSHQSVAEKSQVYGEDSDGP